ncbi:muts domain V-domain-containing protein [Cokeromyces recurvatus]|uniref:muts domain V-domain-containing protein n=1 Tax=Cokeromyces recurvatus TaxID=90255 RepID=UPI002220CA8C|nr:muts domain V-domain-containing protein [Cokeromyces recurvatus]KAI7906331.1 muts domain V-domain-containing protein [Cokeromyces recurvatus]
MSLTETTEELPDVGKPEQQTFVNFFRSLDPTDEGTIRLFEREANESPYYTFHGDDAKYIAENVYKTTSVILYWSGDSSTGLPTTKLTNKAAKAFLRDALLNKQLKIEIWKQNRLEWRLIHKASPGNLQSVEDFLFSSAQLTSAPVVIAVKYSISGENKTVGVAYADTTTNQLGVSQFIDNDLYSNLESLIIQLGVKECLLLSTGKETKDYEAIKIKSLLDRCNVVTTERKKSDFDPKNINQDLNRLLGDEVSVKALPEFELKDAMSSCACVLKYLQLLENENNFGKYTLRHHDLSQYMRLDGPALQALNLLPTAQDGPNKSTSLYGLLNKCNTAQGSRLFAQWLKQPLLNINEITKRQDIVQVFFDDTELRQSLQEDHLKHVPDLHRLSKRLQNRTSNLQDVIRIYQMVIRLPALLQCLEARPCPDPKMATLIEETYTSKIKEYASHLQKLEELVVTSIDLEALENHEYIIKAEFNEDLLALQAEMQSISNQMNNEYVRVCDKLNLEMDKKLRLEKHSLYGHCFRIIGRSESSRLRNKAEYIELATQKAGTFFTTAKLKGLSDRHKDLSFQYDDKQRQFVKEIIDIVATYCPVLESLSAVLAHMDVLISFAHVSVMAPIPYIRPTMYPCGQGNVILEEARHPCLEVQDYVAFIPNNVEMLRNSSEFQVVTGPNMGGKSTYIRQVGVIALMAQIGCFVPCTSASLCIFDSIMARVGAGDSQLKGVSTFMAEMLETSTILKAASRNSLVIIDELGRGTSTYDGLGLAWAISEYIATKIRAFCLFATHFHELTTLNETVPHVKNLHVTVHIGDDHEVTLLYKVNEGVGDRSFGIHVAELANFPPSVINLAKRKANELDEEADFFNSRFNKQNKIEPQQDGNELIKNMTKELAIANQNEDKDTLEEKIQSIKEKYSDAIEQNLYLKQILETDNPSNCDDKMEE